MRSKLLIGGFAAAIAFLLATNPLVAQAAGFITSADIVNNTIKSKDIKNNGVKSNDIRNNSLTGSDVRDGSLTGLDVADSSLTGGDVADSSLTGGDVADSSLTGADLADGSLSGGDLMVRVASATDPSVAVSGTTAPTPALTTSIVAPVRGFLVISGGSDVFDYTNNSFTSCWITLNGATQTPSVRSMYLNGPSNVNEEENCETSITVAVNAGTHQVVLTAVPGATTTFFDETTLQVLFVPFGGTGATPPRPSDFGGAATGNR